MNISDLIHPDLFMESVNSGLIRLQQHPTEDLTIANYTEKAQFSREWNAATLNCRGLIFDSHGNIVARPFPKFFNYGEMDRDMLPRGPVRVQEKMDGSLGILYQEPKSGLFSIATRGSFTSDQAVHATEVLRTRYADFEPYEGFTYLFEIIYPENRIVVDYDGLDDLVLLDVINNATGLSAMEGMQEINRWPGLVVHERPTFTSLESAVRYSMGGGEENAEGFVVYYPTTGDRVKVKFVEYVRLHRILTNVSTTTIWEILANGGGVTEILDNVPDEFFSWVRNQTRLLWKEYERISSATWQTFVSVMEQMPRHYMDVDADPRDKRKWFAQAIAESEYKGILFSWYDDKPEAVDKAIWRLIKPEYERPFVATSEAVA